MFQTLLPYKKLMWLSWLMTDLNVLCVAIKKNMLRYFQMSRTRIELGLKRREDVVRYSRFFHCLKQGLKYLTLFYHHFMWPKLVSCLPNIWGNYVNGIHTFIFWTPKISKLLSMILMMNVSVPHCFGYLINDLIVVFPHCMCKAWSASYVCSMKSWT